ncbi:MAG: hypothetical protein JWM76_5022, partial [Pseudonocardiales bacterium]|nr:hypothetical protein [Pseudonocardiales bacterium]
MTATITSTPSRDDWNPIAQTPAVRQA